MTANINKSVMEKSPLRIGIMVNSVLTNKYIYDFAEWANTQDQICLSHIIVNQCLDKGSKYKSYCTLSRSKFYDDISHSFFHVIKYLEKLLLNTKQRYKNNYNKFNLSSVIDNIVSIDSIDLNTHYRLFSDAEIKRVKELNLDIIIKYSDHVFVGDIANSAKLGIISIQHDNNYYNVDEFSGFWEVYLQQDTTAFTIKHLTEKLDGNETLMRGNFRTQVFFLLNQAALYEKANYYLRLLLIKIYEQGELPDYLPALPCSDSIYGIPKPHNTIYYLSNLYYRLFVKVLYRLFRYHRQWNVAFTRSSWRNAILSHGVSIKNPPNHFLADPFVISRFGKDYCFVEDYDYSSEKGCIVVYELYEKTSKRIGTAIEEPFHMSFPYLFEFQGDLYMCPETSEKKEIRLYKCLDFPCQWQLELTLMKEVSAVDTMLFEKNNKWWMLTNIDPANTGDYGQTLSVFYADSPLSANWKSHPKNPIYIDSTITRNAGLLKDGDRIFRVAQAQGFDIYGKKTSIFEITEIDEFSFTETYVVEINPSFKKGIIGTHHFYSNGVITVFDYLDYAFIKNKNHEKQ